MNATTFGYMQRYVEEALAFWEPRIDVLREFRDRVLMRNGAGRKVVEFYYKKSPPVAAYIAERPVLRVTIRSLLLPVVGLVWMLSA